jgi:hypothetical protein
MYIETIEHVFYTCGVVRNIWLEIQRKLYIAENEKINLTVSDVLFCYRMTSKDCLSVENRNVNTVILYVKYFIWQCKLANIMPTKHNLMNNLNRHIMYIPYFSNIV